MNMTSTITGVRSQHPAFAAMDAKWKRCRAAVSGGDAVKEAGITYLPMLKGQDKTEYAAYKTRALFYNATWRTIDGLSGMLFRKDPIVVVPESILPMLDDVTMSGKPLTVFARQLSHELLTTGRLGLLVDRPTTPTAGMTAAEASRLNLRPFIQLYKAETIYNWKCAWINNKYVLVEVRLSETFTFDPDPKAPFDNPKTEPRYRVLDLFEGKYRVRVYRVEDDRDEQVDGDIFPEMNGKRLDYIPFVFMGTEDLDPDVDDPSLIDLVDANLAHYRLDADYKHGLHFTGLPTATVSGYTPQEKGEKLWVGSPTAWIFPNADAKASFLEFTGQGLGAIVVAMQSTEQMMAILGARMLSPDKKMAEAAETAQIHRAGELSVLAKMAGTLSMGLEKALRIFTDWSGVESKDVSIEINREFMAVTMSPQELTALIMAVQSGELSKESLYRKLQQGDVIAEGVTFEDEQTRIEIQRPNMGVPDAGGTKDAA